MVIGFQKFVMTMNSERGPVSIYQPEAIRERVREDGCCIIHIKANESILDLKESIGDWVVIAVSERDRIEFKSPNKDGRFNTIKCMVLDANFGRIDWDVLIGLKLDRKRLF